MKKIFMVLFAGLLVSAGLQAQKVYKDASNRVILDLTKEAGMPEGAITNEPKSWAGRGTPINIGNTLTGNLETGDINEKVFEKLEIAPSNLGLMFWAEAFTGCIELVSNGGGWRLPTQRELILIWIFKDALNDIFSDGDINRPPFANGYWSATEANNLDAWSMIFEYGSVIISYPKSDERAVRCVREVTTP
jgi:hypothetical protein